MSATRREPTRDAMTAVAGAALLSFCRALKERLSAARVSVLAPGPCGNRYVLVADSDTTELGEEVETPVLDPASPQRARGASTRLVEGAEGVEIWTLVRSPDGGSRGYVRVVAFGTDEGAAVGAVELSVSLVSAVLELATLSELLASRRALDESRRFSEIAGKLSHDLNNTMATVLPNVELIASSADDEKTARRSGAIRESVRRGITALEWRLASYLPRRREIVSIDARQLVVTWAELLDRAGAGACRVRFDVDARRLVRADRAELEDVLIAMAASLEPNTEGGVMSVAGEERRVEDESFLARSGLAPGRYVRIVLDAPPDRGGDPEVDLHAACLTVRAMGGLLRTVSSGTASRRLELWLACATAAEDDGAVDAQKPHWGGGEELHYAGSESGRRARTALALNGLGYRLVDLGDEPESEIGSGVESRALEAVSPVVIHEPTPDQHDEIYRRLAAAVPGARVIVAAESPDGKAPFALDPGSVFVATPLGWTSLSRVVAETLNAARSPMG